MKHNNSKSFFFYIGNDYSMSNKYVMILEHNDLTFTYFVHSHRPSMRSKEPGILLPTKRFWNELEIKVVNVVNGNKELALNKLREFIFLTTLETINSYLLKFEILDPCGFVAEGWNFSGITSIRSYRDIISQEISFTIEFERCLLTF
jgi:hypothetical protein